MEMIIDFQTFYQQTLGKTMEFISEKVNEEKTAAYVVCEHGNRFYIKAETEWAKVVAKEFSVEATVISAKEEDGENVSYHACLKGESGQLFVCTVAFYSFLKSVHFQVGCPNDNGIVSINPQKAYQFHSFLGNIASFMIKEMIETHPSCRLYFVTESIKVHSPFGISIPGYVEEIIC